MTQQRAAVWGRIGWLRVLALTRRALEIWQESFWGDGERVSDGDGLLLFLKHPSGILLARLLLMMHTVSSFR